MPTPRKQPLSLKHLAFLGIAVLYLTFTASNTLAATPVVSSSHPSQSNILLIHGESQTFTAEASDTDANLSGCEWYLNGAYMASHSMSGSNDADSWQKTFPQKGTYVVECIAYDADWNYSGNAATWTVTVVDNAPPMVSKVSPSNDPTAIISNSLPFTLRAFDVNGNLEGAEWYLNGNFMEHHILSGDSCNDTWTHIFKQTGTHTVEAIVYDAENAYSQAISWTITVHSSVHHPLKEFFDDFTYSSHKDNALTAFGWDIVDGISGPPANARYKKENITFSADPNNSLNRFMLLTTHTTHAFDSMTLARIESDMIFLEGTYAARVYFDNTPTNYQDGNIETFYSINTLKYPNDPDYAECDFEYLPYNIWGGGNTGHTMYLSTWETYQEAPWDPNNASTALTSDLSGWHTLLFQATNGHSVGYFIDGIFQGEHILSNKNDSVYPETPMQIAFANWIWTGPNHMGLGSSSKNRSCTMKVDWVFHAKEEVLNTAQVNHLINDFRDQSIQRFNSINADKATTDIRSDETGDILLYPNPTTNHFTISCRAHHKIKKVEVLDSLGKTLLTGYPDEKNSSVQVDIHTLHKGIYIVNIHMNHRIFTKKIVKE